MIGYVPYQLDDHWILSIKSMIPCSKSWFSKTHQKHRRPFIYLEHLLNSVVPEKFNSLFRSPIKKVTSCPQRRNRIPLPSFCRVYVKLWTCKLWVSFFSILAGFHPFSKRGFLKRAARFRGEHTVGTVHFDSLSEGFRTPWQLEVYIPKNTSGGLWKTRIIVCFSSIELSSFQSIPHGGFIQP